MEKYLFKKEIEEEEEIKKFNGYKKSIAYNEANEKLKELLEKKLPLEDKDKNEIEEVLKEDYLGIEEINGQINQDDIENIENIIKNASSKDKIKEIKYCVEKPNIKDVENVNLIIKEIIDLKDSIIEDINSIKEKKELQEQILKDDSLKNFNFEADEKEKREKIKLKEDKIIENIKKLNDTLVLCKNKIKCLRRYLETINEENIKIGIGLTAKKEIKRLEDEILRIEKALYLLSNESLGIENY